MNRIFGLILLALWSSPSSAMTCEALFVEAQNRPFIEIIDRPDLDIKKLTLEEKIHIDYRGYGTRITTTPISLKAKLRAKIEKLRYQRVSGWSETNLPAFKQRLWDLTKLSGREHAQIYVTNENGKIVFMSTILRGGPYGVNIHAIIVELKIFLNGLKDYGRRYTVHNVHTHPRSSDGVFGFSRQDINLAENMRFYEFDNQERFYHFTFRNSVIDGNVDGIDRVEIGNTYLPAVPVSF